MNLNPHQAAPVELFVGRKEMLQELLTRLPDKRFYSVFGGKGMGKTSLLYAVQQGLKTQDAALLPVYVSCQRGDTLEPLIQNITQALLKAVSVSEPQRKQIETASVQKNLAQVLEWVQQFLFEQEQQVYTIILLLNNVHRLSAESVVRDAVESMLNTLVDQGAMGLLIAGRNSVWKEFPQQDREGSFLPHLLTKEHELSCLDLNDTETLLKRLQPKVSDGFIQAIHTLSNGHPFQLAFYLDQLEQKNWTTRHLQKQATRKNQEHLNRVLGEQRAIEQSTAKKPENSFMRWLKGGFRANKGNNKTMNNKVVDLAWQRLAMGLISVVVIVGLLKLFAADLSPAILGVAVLLTIAALLSLVISRIAFGVILVSGLLLVVVLGAFDKLEDGLSEAGFIITISKVLDKLGLVLVEEPSARSAQPDSALADYVKLQKILAELPVQETSNGAVITLGDVLFATGKSSLQPTALKDLQRLAEYLQTHPKHTISIEGHADSAGDVMANLKLSRQRAEAVKIELLKFGIVEKRMTVVAYGESKPLEKNDSVMGKQLNRRVEIIISVN